MPARAPATKIESLRKLRRSNLPKSRHILPPTNRAVLRPSQFLLTTPNLFPVRLLDSLMLRQQRLKSCLFDMPIPRQRLGKPFVRHHHKGNTVRQRPVLVWTGVVECETPIEKFRRGHYDLSSGVFYKNPKLCL